MKIRIYYEDTDAGAIVYHTKYINFCERARSELFFKNGLSPHSSDGYFVVTNLNANFISSAKFGDLLEVKTKVKEIKKASCILEQEIFLEDGTKAIFKLQVTLAYVNNDKIKKIPHHITQLLGGYLQ